MSIIKCKECGKDISDQAAMCPHCGVKRTSRATWLVLIAVALFMFGILAREDGQAPPPAAAGATVKAPTAPTPPSVPQQWIYGTSTNKIGNKTSMTATLVSENEHDLKFPYGPNIYAQLTLAQHPRHGLQAMVHIKAGQIICHSDTFGQCSIDVRFDDGPPQKFTAVMPSDHSTTTLFIDNEKRFIEALRKAKTTIVELTIYQSGSPNWTFNTAGLVWPPH